MATNTQYPNHRLIIPYAAPYFAYIAIATLLSSLSSEWNYLIRIACVTGLLLWARRWYVPLVGPRSFLVSIIFGIAFGLAGCVLWVVFLSPFVGTNFTEWNFSAFLLRLTASTLLVPIFEELVMRVLVFRLALQWYNLRKASPNALEEVMHNKSIDSVLPGEWNYFAVIVSTILFTLGHQVVEWPAAIVYGLLMASLWIIRKDVISFIVAHATTNFCLGLYVFTTKSWWLW